MHSYYVSSHGRGRYEKSRKMQNADVPGRKDVTMRRITLPGSRVCTAVTCVPVYQVPGIEQAGIMLQPCLLLRWSTRYGRYLLSTPPTCLSRCLVRYRVPNRLRSYYGSLIERSWDNEVRRTRYIFRWHMRMDHSTNFRRLG